MNTTMQRFAAVMAVLILGLSMSCDGSIHGPVGEDDPIDDPPVEDDELVGAGERSLTRYWPSIDVPFAENTKMLNFQMMQSEVLRATTLSWVENNQDQWEANRTVLGGADYVQTWSDDRTPSQQKIVTWRKMAFSVCGALVAQEAGQTERVVFDVLDPGAAIDPADPLVADQVRSIFRKFFYVAPSQTEETESVALLGALQQLENQTEAWRGLCAAYLSSMRFLTY